MITHSLPWPTTTKKMKITVVFAVMETAVIPDGKTGSRLIYMNFTEESAVMTYLIGSSRLRRFSTSNRCPVIVEFRSLSCISMATPHLGGASWNPQDLGLVKNQFIRGRDWKNISTAQLRSCYVQLSAEFKARQLQGRRLRRRIFSTLDSEWAVWQSNPARLSHYWRIEATTSERHGSVRSNIRLRSTSASRNFRTAISFLMEQLFISYTC